jgi:hypothetical protein
VPAADRPAPRRSNLTNPFRSTIPYSPLQYIKDEYRKQKTKLKEGKEEPLLILSPSSVNSVTSVADPRIFLAGSDPRIQLKIKYYQTTSKGSKSTT